ncbi:unnamed protein product [Vitrella brassicaformis CCMP3155]|uniref:Uncharacterized protein n=1 Tax=Vitrella brassicaformis (strain CCMP3155) TaxID=1169540 RepID=A0A0G4G4D5_VITBC|nr:unnamed protein product [Vitrella brassicaformis CCMP3155]|eukprot:CEM22794.1 unnamed protein product [Vitrella brassicaformis CCMP3155]
MSLLPYADTLIVDGIRIRPHNLIMHQRVWRYGLEFPYFEYATVDANDFWLLGGGLGVSLGNLTVSDAPVAFQPHLGNVPTAEQVELQYYNVPDSFIKYTRGPDGMPQRVIFDRRDQPPFLRGALKFVDAGASVTVPDGYVAEGTVLLDGGMRGERVGGFRHSTCTWWMPSLAHFSRVEVTIIRQDDITAKKKAKADRTRRMLPVAEGEELAADSEEDEPTHAAAASAAPAPACVSENMSSDPPAAARPGHANHGHSG